MTFHAVGRSSSSGGGDDTKVVNSAVMRLTLCEWRRSSPFRVASIRTIRACVRDFSEVRRSVLAQLARSRVSAKDAPRDCLGNGSACLRIFWPILRPGDLWPSANSYIFLSDLFSGVSFNALVFHCYSVPNIMYTHNTQL